MGLNTINHPGQRLVTALTATGTNQATAYPLVGGTAFHEFTTVGSGTGCILPGSPLPITVTISNAGASTINVYPPVGGTIDGGSVDAAATLATGKSGTYWAAGPLTWYSTTSGTVTGGGTGTVTSITGGYGLDGGTITTTGTLSISDQSITFAKMQHLGGYELICNPTGVAATPTQCTLSALIDAAVGSTQGDILYRDSTAWQVLAPGTTGQLLASQGAAANPHWITASGSGTVTSIAAGTGLSGGTITTSGTIALATLSTLNVLANTTGGTAAPAGVTLSALIDAAVGSTQGDLLYRDSATWQVLAPGTSGQILASQGASANPHWITGAGGTGTVTSVTAGAGLSGGTFTTSGTIAIAAAGVTYAMIQNLAASSVLANPTGSPAAASEVTLGAGLAFSGTTVVATGPRVFTALLGLGANIATGVLGNYLVCPFAGTFTRWDMVCPTAAQPSGASLVVDVLKSAAGAGSFTTIFTSKPTILTGANHGGGTVGDFSTTTFSAGDVLEFNVTTAGGGAVQNVTLAISSRMNQ